MEELGTEEAVEVILGTPWYIDCDVCIEVKSRGFKTNIGCKKCGSFSFVINPVYVRACERLGMPPPPEPEQELKRRLDVLFEHMRARGIKLDDIPDV